MSRKLWAFALVVAVAGWASQAQAGITVKGKVTDGDGNGLRGVMVSAFDSEIEMSVSVFSDAQGRYEIKDASDGTDSVRARRIGLDDEFVDVETGKNHAGIDIRMSPTDDLDFQRPAHDRLKQLKFESESEGLNFRMMCTYCHQVGTMGFRTPEEPVDWEVMVTRMDGFAGLQAHTKETLVERLVEVFGPGAEENWEAYEPPEPLQGRVLEAQISEWAMGAEDNAMIHDLEIGTDGLIYVVDMVNDAIATLDPKTGERIVYGIPGGKEPYTDDVPRKGPHSLEPDADGNMWITLALSGQMAMFNRTTKEFTIVSGAVAPRPRGAYPHSLRLDQKGVVWYTDAGTNSVFSLDPSNDNVVKQYQLLRANEAANLSAGRGESRGITPYGIDVAPDGKIWYSKLNGQRIGRIDPTLPDGDPDQIKEWVPPVHGPRRLQVGNDGLVWVPGWASGDFASFNPETEEWKVIPLPSGWDSLPYALSIHPDTGDIWICGTGRDSMHRYDPKTGEMTEYPMPTRVTYTREVEFDEDGNIWVSNSNYPARHIENHKGSLIRIAAP